MTARAAGCRVRGGAPTCVRAVPEGRVGEQGGGDRLERDADAHLLHHVRLVLEVYVHLRRPCTLSGAAAHGWRDTSTWTGLRPGPGALVGQEVTRKAGKGVGVSMHARTAEECSGQRSRPDVRTWMVVDLNIMSWPRDPRFGM